MPLAKWIPCKHIVDYTINDKKVYCRNTAKYIMDETDGIGKPVCDLHTKTFSRLRVIQPHDFDQYGV